MSDAGLARIAREKAEQRRLKLEALELRDAGYSFRRIAEAQGCTIATATKRYKKACQAYLPQELVEQVRSTELDRFDTLTVVSMNLMTKAFEAGDIDAVCKLQDKVLAVHDRRATLIPMKVAARVEIDQRIEHVTEQERELADLLGRAAQGVEDQLRILIEDDV